MNFPPIPPWNGAHPLIVHAPLGALPVAAVLVLCALFSVKSRRAWATAAFIALVFGTVGTVLATNSGDATEHAIIIPQSVRPVFREHEHLGDRTRNLFLIAAAVYTAVWVGALIWNERCRRSVWTAVHAVFLAYCAFALLTLANTGHVGARLVHEFGLKAPIAGSMEPASRAPAGGDDEEREAVEKRP